MAITGVAGAEYGIRGWIAATDLNTHQEVWRTYTIPAKGEPGSETWKDDHDAAQNGGGSTWVTGSYDPATDTIVWGVGNPGPDWDNAYRPGDNLYTDSSLGLDAKTGKIKWFFQHTPNDPYDYDSVAENVLVDAGGRHLALEADRNGIAYAIDRTTGQFVWATPFVKKLTWTKGIDPRTGKPVDYDPHRDVQVYVASVTPSRENKVTMICPGNMGGKNWPPTAYNPELGRWYIPVIESCNRITVQETVPGKSYKPREFFTGGGPSDPERITGSLTAIDTASGRIVGKAETRYPLLGGVLATPELVFTGEPDGTFHAFDAKTLTPLWQFATGGGISAPRSPSWSTGRSTSRSSWVSAGPGTSGSSTPPLSSSASSPPRRSMSSGSTEGRRVRSDTSSAHRKGAWRRRAGGLLRGAAVLLPALLPAAGVAGGAAAGGGEGSPLPPAIAAIAALPDRAPADLAEGQRLYRANCAGCHKWHGGGGGGYGGAALSLRATSLDRAAIIETIACGRPGTGMPYHLRGAYEGAGCYGLSEKDVGAGMVLEANSFLRPPEIAAIADYVIAAIRGRGEPTLAECRAFFGAGSRVCDIYETPAPAAVTSPAAAGTEGR